MGPYDHYDAYIQDAMRSWSCPGVALSIVKGDGVLYRGVFGLRDSDSFPRRKSA